MIFFSTEGGSKSLSWLQTQVMSILPVTLITVFNVPKHHPPNLALTVALTYFPPPLGIRGYLVLIWIL